MDRNLILAVALSMLVFTAWSAWQASMAPPPEEAALEQLLDGETAEGAGEAEATPSVDRAEPAQPLTGAQEQPEAIAAEREFLDSGRAVEPWSVELDSPRVSSRLTNRGATFDRWALLDYKQRPREAAPVELLAQSAPYDVVLATPLEELGFGDLSSVRWDVVDEGPDEVTFALVRGGVRVTKTYRRAASDYGFHLDIKVENQTDRIVSPEFEIVWPAVLGESKEGEQLSLLAFDVEGVTRELVAGLGGSGFMGGIFGGGDDGPPTFTDGVRWAGTDLKYFAGLVVPPKGVGSKVVFETLESGKAGAMVMRLEPTPVDPGLSVTRSFFVFMGPKEPPLLESLGNELSESIDRGWSWVSPLAAFFERALHLFYAFIPNYGVVIILLTILVRLATWPIMAKQMQSAEKMRELMPRLKELQEKYKDDKQKQSEETFKLYRETGVNPLAGCFPLLLQMPVFIGLFYALQSSIDLRHAPFMLWINDLSQPATLFYLPGLDFPVRLLPILMGASMYAQQKMTPQTGMDPAQQKMMLVMMPGMMLFISWRFPSGLVLYWTVSNLLGIGHQLLVRRKMEQKKAAG